MQGHLLHVTTADDWALPVRRLCYTTIIVAAKMAELLYSLFMADNAIWQLIEPFLAALLAAHRLIDIM